MIALSEPRTFVARELVGDRQLLDKVVEHFRRGNDLFDDRDFVRALKEFKRALALAPDDPIVLNNLGAALSLLGRDKDALAACERALLRNPDHSITLHNLGVSLAQLHRYDEAVTAYDRALELIPDDPYTLANRGLALAHLGQSAEALTALDRAIELQPDDQGLVSCRRKIVEELLRGLRRKGVVSWAGGKPTGSRPRIPITSGPPVSDYVIEDRR